MFIVSIFVGNDTTKATGTQLCEMDSVVVITVSDWNICVLINKHI